jgi:hypothetical protein
VVIPIYHQHYGYTWPRSWYGNPLAAYYGTTPGLLNSQSQQLQTYGASTIVDAHTHEEGN